MKIDFQAELREIEEVILGTVHAPMYPDSTGETACGIASVRLSLSADGRGVDCPICMSVLVGRE